MEYEREKTGIIDLKNLAPDLVARGPSTKVDGIKFRVGKTLTEVWCEIEGKSYCFHVEENDAATLEAIKQRIYARAELTGHKASR